MKTKSLQEKELPVPAWFNEGGLGTTVATFRISEALIRLVTKSSNVIIRRSGHVWMVDYFSSPGSELLSGDITLTPRNMFSAFTDLSEYREHHYMYDQMFGADAAVPGRYMRKKDFLVIPGPDRNGSITKSVAIFLTPEVKKRMREILL